MPPKNKSKEPAGKGGANSTYFSASLPLWDDAQIATENWGASLAALSSTQAAAAASTKEARGSKGTPRDAAAGGGNCFVDAEVRQSWEALLAESAGQLYDGAVTRTPVRWERPVDLVRPFRPVVHRNTTPFLNPYASREELRPMEAREEDNRHKAAAAAGNSGRKGDSKEPDGPFYQLYPETVTLLDDLVGQDVNVWLRGDCQEAVRRYREVPALMDPYDPTLVIGCEETPAEACGSRYSTALRHKLQRAEALAALEQTPPFLMSAFNSVVNAIEDVQRTIASGAYLWELIYPKAPGTLHPVYNPYGKYAVKLFIDGAYRKVLVDDFLPVDELGRSFITVTSRRELWPAILAKALFKAYVPDCRHAVFTDPEMLMAALLGDWVPQYIDGARQPVAAAALFATACAVQQEREAEVLRLREEEEERLRLQEEQKALAAEAAESGTVVDDKNAASELADGKQPGGTNKSRKSSNASNTTSKSGGKGKGGKSSKKEPQGQQGNGGDDARTESRASSVARRSDAGSEAGDSRTFLEENDDGVDRRPFIACGVRSVNYEVGRYGVGVGKQLYSISSVVPFRSTFAINIRTTPRTALTPGIFELEKDAKDVREVVASNARTDMTVSEAQKEASVFSCWLTLEEFTEQLPTVVVWRDFGKRYSNKVRVEYQEPQPSPAQQPPTLLSPSKRRSSTMTSPLPPALVPEATPETVVWLTVRAEHPTELAIVTLGGPSPAPETDEAQSGGGAKALQSVRKGQTATNPPPPATTTGANAADVSEGQVATAGGAPPPPSVTHRNKMVHLQYYSWDIVDPLTNSLSVPCEYGVHKLHILELEEGVHLFRVTIPAMEPNDSVRFFSNSTLEIDAEFGEISKGCKIRTLTDAGTHPAVATSEEESVWFKRRFRVSTPTKLTMVLSTLGPYEDLAAHRSLPAPAANNKPAKAANARAAQGGKQTNTSKEPQEQLDTRVCPISILRFTKLLLINLDNRDEVVVGEAGKLAQLSLQPNDKGYMLVAYTLLSDRDVDEVGEAFRRAASGSKRGGAAGGSEQYNASDMQRPALYGKGNWKLTVRSDNELSGYDVIAHAANTVSEEGHLERGAVPLFLRYSWPVTETTHVTLLMDFRKENFSCPFSVRLLRYADAQASTVVSKGAGTAPSAGATAASNAATTAAAAAGAAPFASPNPSNELPTPGGSGGGSGSADGGRISDAPLPYTVVYESPLVQTHLFVPDVLLEVEEKSKGAVYVLEASIPEESAAAWETLCHSTQEARFSDMAYENSVAAMRRRERELAEMQNNPDGYIAQKQEELQMLQTAIAAAASADSNPKKRGATAATGERKKSSTFLRSSGRNSALPSSRQASLALAPNTYAITLDNIDTNLQLSYALQMFFSVPRVDARAALPADESLTQLRQAWKTALSAAYGSDAAAGATAAGGGSSSGKSGSSSKSKHQKDALATEMQQRAEAGRASRRQFLTNPTNVYIPVLVTGDEAGANGPSQTAPTPTRAGSAVSPAANAAAASAHNTASGQGSVAASSNSGAPRVDFEDGTHNLYRHAPPFSPSEYEVRRLQIRAHEYAPPTAVDPAPGTGNATTAKEGKKGRASKKDQAASAAAAASPQLTTVFPSDEELISNGLRRPLQEYLEEVAERRRSVRERQQHDLKAVRGIAYEYWTHRQEVQQHQQQQQAATAAEGSGKAAPADASVSSAQAMPVVVAPPRSFPSIIGTRVEDDAQPPSVPNAKSAKSGSASNSASH